MVLSLEELEVLKEIVYYNVRVSNEEYTELGEDDLITFLYEEFEIRNPFMDETDMLKVEPTSYYGKENIKGIINKYKQRQSEINSAWEYATKIFSDETIKEIVKNRLSFWQKELKILNTVTINELNKAINCSENNENKRLNMALLGQDLNRLKGWETGRTSSNNNSIIVERDGHIYKLTVEHVRHGKISQEDIKRYLH